ncbi:MAG: hypothetical protein ACLQKK_19945 [Rhodomicrobium sp.]
MSLASTIAHAPRGVLDPSIQSILPRIPWPHDGIENCYLQLCQEEVGRISNHPSGLDDVVFLRTALSEIGEALFPLIWSSREMNPASLEISALPDKPNPLGLRLDWAEEILEIHFPDVATARACRATYVQRNKCSKKEKSIEYIPPSWTDEEWKLVCDKSTSLAESNIPIKVRGYIARAVVTKLCMVGEIKSFARKLEGGPILPIRADMWNTSHWMQRFWLYRFDYDDPHNGNPRGSHWILLERETVARFKKGYQRGSGRDIPPAIATQVYIYGLHGRTGR